MSSPYIPGGLASENIVDDIQDVIKPVELVSAAHAFGQPSVTVAALNVGDVVLQSWFQVTTAYNAGTTNVITLGNTATGDKFLAAAAVTEGTPGVYPATVPIPGTAETVASNLVLSYAQTGTAATTGAGRVYALIAREATFD